VEEFVFNCAKSERKLDYFIFCEDDHIFTPHYNAAYLRKNIEGALKQKADILCGGIGGTDIAIPISKNRFCIGEFYCTQFVVIFSNLLKFPTPSYQLFE
jgi:hypothetical protein